jgi:hypothetical protein
MRPVDTGSICAHGLTNDLTKMTDATILQGQGAELSIPTSIQGMIDARVPNRSK